MKCPICSVEMKLTQRDDVEIDYCPQCRGVWLDRGELEKIIARMESQPDRDDDERDESDHHDERRRSSHRDRNNGEGEYRREGEYRYGGKKREGFLSNLFDMFGD